MLWGGTMSSVRWSEDNVGETLLTRHMNSRHIDCISTLANIPFFFIIHTICDKTDKVRYNCGSLF